MNKNMSEESHKKIFISHSSKDKQIVDIFVDNILYTMEIKHLGYILGNQVTNE